MADQDLMDAIAGVRAEFPALGPHLDNTVAQYGTPSGPGDDRVLEFYHPDESYNPNPGKNTLELFDRNLKGPMLQEAIAGDMLHRLGAFDRNTGQAVDPKWQRLRQELGASRTQEQRTIDLKAYQQDKASPVYGGEIGSTEQWDQQSRLDAYVRAVMFPKSNPEWSEFLTPEQRAIGDRMRNYLKGLQ